MDILDTAREIVQEAARKNEYEQNWNSLLELMADSPLGLDIEIAKKMLGF